jgi:methionyl-tRNA synthetase
VQLIEAYGLDQTRYFLLREVPFGNDGDFSRDAMVTRMNHDLANDYGNLVQRVLSMIQRNCDARVPAPGAYDDADHRLIAAAGDMLARVRAAMAEQALSRSLEMVFEVIASANRYVDAQAPWALRKTDPERMATVLYVLAEVIRRLALVTQAFMPDASGKILDQLAVPDDVRSLASFEDVASALQPGAALPPPSGVFPRFAGQAL